MKITVLAENRSGNGLEGEFGLSLLVSANGCDFLVDTGASPLFAVNLQKSGLYVTPDFCVCSHNHYDHNGGLDYFLDSYPQAKCFVSDNTQLTFGSAHFPHKRYGKPKCFYEKYADRLTFISDTTEISNGIFLFKAPYIKEQCRNRHLYIQKYGLLLSDRFEHELAVAVLENGQLTVISPCSHRGAVNILQTAVSLFPNAKRCAFVGGLHTQGSSGVMNCSADEVKSIALGLKDLGFGCYYLAHCTGETAFSIIIEVLKDKAKSFVTGDVLSLSLS